MKSWKGVILPSTTGLSVGPGLVFMKNYDLMIEGYSLPFIIRETFGREQIRGCCQKSEKI